MDQGPAHHKALHSGFMQLGSLRVHHTTGATGRRCCSSTAWARRATWSGGSTSRVIGRTIASSRPTSRVRPQRKAARRATASRYFARGSSSSTCGPATAPAVMVGTSLGGRMALEMALRRPQSVRGLVLVNSLGLGRPKVQHVLWAGHDAPGGRGRDGGGAEALHWVPPHAIRRVRGAVPGASRHRAG